MDAKEILDREFLHVRASLLDVAAALDRLERAAGSVADDPRLKKIEQAITLLSDPGDDRAAQVQLLFSLKYDPEWRREYQV